MKKWYLAWLMIPLLSGCYPEPEIYYIQYLSIKNCTNTAITVSTDIKPRSEGFDGPVLLPGQEAELEPGNSIYIGRSDIDEYYSYSSRDVVYNCCFFTYMEDSLSPVSTLSVSTVIDGEKITKTWTFDQRLDLTTRQFFNGECCSRYISEEYSPDFGQTLIRIDNVFKVYSSDFR